MLIKFGSIRVPVNGFMAGSVGNSNTKLEVLLKYQRFSIVITRRHARPKLIAPPVIITTDIYYYGYCVTLIYFTPNANTVKLIKLLIQLLNLIYFT